LQLICYFPNCPIKEAEKSWKKLYGHKRIADVINLVRFIDGIAEVNPQQIMAA
jgi:hypothetical protein